MIFIALNTIFNGFILGVMLLIGNSLLHIQALNTANSLLLGYIISATLSIIGYTKLANKLIGIFISGRQPITREINRIEPILKQIIEKVNKKFNAKYTYQDLKIKITDSKIANTCALGYNKIIISDGCLKYFNDSQLTAMLSHEFAHLYYKDTIRSTSFILGSFATKILMQIFVISLTIQTTIANIIKKSKHGLMISIISFFPFLVLLPIFALGWIGNKIFIILNAQLSKKNTYRADAFTVHLGYKNELIEALEILNDLRVENNTFIDKIMSSNLAIKLRIGAIEDYIIQNQYPDTFYQNKTNSQQSTTNTKELAILIGYFIFIGITLHILLLK